MGGFDDAPTLAGRFRQLAAATASSAPLNAELLLGMAADFEAGGPVREICRGWESPPPGGLVQLRLLAGLYRIVLQGRTPELAAYYRALGGTAGPAGAWEVARPVVAANVAELRAALDIAPQTNEPGRSAALVTGIIDAVGRSGCHRVRLLEIGASAGLNLRADHYRVGGPGAGAPWASGPAQSPVDLSTAVLGDVRPLPYEVVDRRGCDLAPVDPTTPEGRLRLTSFVWPDHVERHHRLAAALEVASRVPAPVDKAGAAEWLPAMLSAPTAGDVLTVVWHSVVSLYLPAAERAVAEEAIAAAGERGPLAHIAMEFPDRGQREPAQLTVEVWRDGRRDRCRRVLGTVADHGVPVRLDATLRLPQAWADG